MRRLREFQIVLLQAAEIRVPCCAIATAADECVLEPRSQRDVAVPGLPRQIECAGHVLRCGPAGAAVRFEDLDPALQHVFERMIFALRQRIARRRLDADLSIWRDAA